MTTREESEPGSSEGGVSRGPFASLNLSSTVGDDPERVRENWDRLREATGLSFARVRQVHGCRVVEAINPSTLLKSRKSAAEPAMCRSGGGSELRS